MTTTFKSTKSNPTATLVKRAARKVCRENGVGRGYRKGYRVRGMGPDEHHTDYCPLDRAADKIEWDQILEITVYRGTKIDAPILTVYEVYFSSGAVFAREHGITEEVHLNDDTMLITL